MNFCEICECDPCDCEDMGLKNEFWGILQKRSQCNGKISVLAYSSNRFFSQCDSKMEKRNKAKDRIFPSGLQNTIKGTRYSTYRNDTQSSCFNGDRT